MKNSNLYKILSHLFKLFPSPVQPWQSKTVAIPSYLKLYALVLKLLTQVTDSLVTMNVLYKMHNTALQKLLTVQYSLTCKMLSMLLAATNKYIDLKHKRAY